jgi:hypothetical protein
MMGRPSTFTEAAVDEICERLSDGETLRSICRDAHMPQWRTVYDWIDARPDVATRIARARDVGFDSIGESTIDICDDIPERGPDGKIDPAWVAHQKLRVDQRMKLLAKWSPKKYGDKVQVAGDAESPIQHTVTWQDD